MTDIKKTGIVIVSYNAHKALELTLSSLRISKLNKDYKLILVDNNSRPEEQAEIKNAFERYALADWNYIQTGENLGFSGGNNVGIKEFLLDEEIDSICLLNSDVIVTDYWLDRMLEKNEPAVSAVTNKADSEQCVPCDYDYKIEDTIDHIGYGLNLNCYKNIQNFSNRRYEEFQGAIVNSDVTFFCVLIWKSVIQNVGLLDETFFPGGYEDDDYCLRLKKAGIEPKLCRDVYIHHWGSQSFGQLQYQYFKDSADKNRSYLEQKHNIVWEYRAQRPFLSFIQDCCFLLENNEKNILDSYRLESDSKLDVLLETYISEYSAVKKFSDLGVKRGDFTAQLEEVDTTKLKASWQNLKSEFVVRSGHSYKNRQVDIEKRAEKFMADVNGCYSYTIGTYSLLNRYSSDLLTGQDIHTLSLSFFEKVKKAVKTIRNFKGTVFFGGFPSEDRLNDGYFQRIKAIDSEVDSTWRVYVEHSEDKPWWSIPAKQVISISVSGSRLSKLKSRLLALLLVLKCRKIYFHSVLRMHDSRFGYLFYLPFIRKAIDIHGVVPEEFRYYNDYYSALLYEKYESLAVKKADLVITVSEKMKDYLSSKYKENIEERTAILPIFSLGNSKERNPENTDGKIKVIYAGGLHKWQQAEKMVSAITRSKVDFDCYFFSPEPKHAKELFAKEDLARLAITIESKRHDELGKYYLESDFGFILRQDIIVNEVACPTKLIEYINYGIIPIMDSTNVGDFVELGMKYITVNDFVDGKIPNPLERSEIRENNYRVLDKLKKIKVTGQDSVNGYLLGRVFHGRNRLKLAKKIKGKLNNTNLLSFLASKLWKIVKPRTTEETKSVSIGDVVAKDETFDIIVQADNFVAGGLENVVIDINTEFEKSGIRTCLLIFGEIGPAYQSAMDKGLTVKRFKYNDNLYSEFLDRTKPKVVMTHYSTNGLKHCKIRKIFTMQIIHNMYMWFSQEDKLRFQSAYEYTDLFIAVSKVALDYASIKLDLPLEKSIVIPNGVEISKFKLPIDEKNKLDLRDKLGFKEDDYIYLSVGSINHQKNSGSLVRSFSKIAKVADKAKLLMVGPVYENDIYLEIQNEIERSKLQNQVIHVKHDSDIAKYYSIADAFVHSPFFEGAPLVVLEAIASDLPVVTIETLIPKDLEDESHIRVVPPHVDLFKFDGHITELKSSSIIEEEFSQKMLELYDSRAIRKDSPNIHNYDKALTFEKYVEIVKSNI